MFRLLRRLAPAAAWLAAALSAAAPAAPAASAPLSIVVNPGDHGEQSRHVTYAAVRALLAEAMREARVSEVSYAMSLDATADLAATRSQLHDIFVVPAHVAGSALRHGYVPLLAVERPMQAVLVTRKDARLDSLAAAAGTRLGVPLQDSLVTYLLRGEINAANSSIRRHFRSVTHTRHQDALLLCLRIGACDVVAVERAVFERWVAQGEAVSAMMQSRPVPGLTVMVRRSLAGTPTARAVQSVLTRGFAALAGNAGLDRAGEISPQAFEYVSTLGYFTPRELPGTRVVDAAAVVGLMAAGAIYVDVRNDAEFKAGHVRGAQLVPYIERSAKDTDFDPSQDGFEIGRLPADRDAALIFACNGPECWKSYKASHAAIGAGYRNVHWFRGGFPEWRSAGREFARAEP